VARTPRPENPIELEAFQVYVDLGPQRNCVKVANVLQSAGHVDVTADQVRRWRLKHGWENRIAALAEETALQRSARGGVERPLEAITKFIESLCVLGETPMEFEGVDGDRLGYLHAYWQFSCNMTEACRTFGVSRVRVKRWEEEDEAFREALGACREALADFAESMLYSQARSGNMTAILKILTNLRPETWNEERFRRPLLNILNMANAAAKSDRRQDQVAEDLDVVELLRVLGEAMGVEVTVPALLGEDDAVTEHDGGSGEVAGAATEVEQVYPSHTDGETGSGSPSPPP
jgi:hypothetical protein